VTKWKEGYIVIGAICPQGAENPVGEQDGYRRASLSHGSLRLLKSHREKYSTTNRKQSVHGIPMHKCRVISPAQSPFIASAVIMCTSETGSNDESLGHL
jgi:hypothetical protein